jgi:stringent starvation protein B
VRRQTATGGSNSAGSGRVLRLDPLSLPVSYSAHDTRADGGIRHIELHRERVVLRRAVSGMRMAVNVRVSDFLGIALRETGELQMLVLVHRDPSLSIPLCASNDPDEISQAWTMWSETFALPQLEDQDSDAAPRRRRRNAIRSRRPRFLMRRRVGYLLNPAAVYRDEREIIARD